MRARPGLDGNLARAQARAQDLRYLGFAVGGGELKELKIAGVGAAIVLGVQPIIGLAEDDVGNSSSR